MRIKRQIRGAAPALLMGLVQVAGPALASAAAPANQSVDCRIRTERRDGLLIIEALASSRSEISGRYVLSVSKHSAGGSSRSIQHGGFRLKPDLENGLATTAVEAAAAGHLTATLTLEWKQGKSTCTFPQ